MVNGLVMFFFLVDGGLISALSISFSGLILFVCTN